MAGVPGEYPAAAGAIGGNSGAGASSDSVGLGWLDMAEGLLASSLGVGDGRTVAWLLYESQLLAYRCAQEVRALQPGKGGSLCSRFFTYGFVTWGPVLAVTMGEKRLSVVHELEPCRLGDVTLATLVWDRAGEGCP